MCWFRREKSKIHQGRGAFVCLFLFIHLMVGLPSLFAQEEYRFALVIGNSDYQGMGKLTNPVNDAVDMSETLERIGFDVDLVLDASLEDMEEAVLRFKNRMSEYPGSVGFFFYAGHGVQSGGENYLIPVDARINSEAMLRSRAVPLQFVLDSLKETQNKLNVVILDACRDNPFSWARSSSRGLAVVGQQPPASIVVYSTSAGRVAEDGTGRNSVFTEELIQHLRTPGLDISEVLRRTGQAVQSRTNGAQIPAIYSQFFDFFTLREEGDEEYEEEENVLTYLPEGFETAPADIQIAVATAENLAQDSYGLSGWQVLMETDPDHTDLYMLAAKIRFSLQYGKANPSFTTFRFTDTNEGEGEEVPFEPNTILKKLKTHQEEYPPVLSFELANFYYVVYTQKIKGYPLSASELRNVALQSYRRIIDQKELSFSRYTWVWVRYAELLIDEGKLTEAISMIKTKIQTLSPENEWDRDELWKSLLDLYVRGGKPEEALREIDAKLREIGSSAETEQLLYYYKKGAEIALTSRKKSEFDRYTTWIEKTFPNQWDGGIFRHRWALANNDIKGAHALAITLYQHFPLESILKENVLEELLGNYLRHPSWALEVIALLDQLISLYKSNPKKLFELYMYRSAYRYQAYIGQLEAKGEQMEDQKKRQILRESFSDLEQATAIYKKQSSQDPEILDLLKNVRENYQMALETLGK